MCFYSFINGLILLKTGKEWRCDFLAKEKPGDVWYIFILWFALVIHNWHTHIVQATMGSNIVFQC